MTWTFHVWQGVINRDELRELYRNRARNYDLTANLYYLIGFREVAYRKRAVDTLGLRHGDTVVDLCCGTGLNFPFLLEQVGPQGKVVGVDMTDKMLDGARRRVEQNGWRNVKLVQSDAAEFSFPEGLSGVISTFALTLVPEFDNVILDGCRALKSGGRWTVLDFKMPSRWTAVLAPLMILLTRPFGVTKDLADRHPWESMQKYLKDVSMDELYMGFAYIASGFKGEVPLGN